MSEYTVRWLRFTIFCIILFVFYSFFDMDGEQVYWCVTIGLLVLIYFGGGK